MAQAFKSDSNGDDVVVQRRDKMSKRSVKVANCSGYAGDPAYQMLRQATGGDVDFITGDYLAEMNLAQNAEAYREGKHPGYVDSAWEGLRQTIDVVAQRGIKIVINGGSLNPSGLAVKVSDLCKEQNLDAKIAYVSGDDLCPALGDDLASSKLALLSHLDSANQSINLPPNTLDPSERGGNSFVTANAYLGARAIVQGLRDGADIVICGRVADASPVIGCAWFWHSWKDTDYDCLAGALIAGHLIECSAYVTGGNFSGFTEYNQECVVDPGFPIAEIEADGSCIIAKHENTGGFINIDTVRCQFLYELQGSVYLNSDVKAYLNDVVIRSVGKDRVHVSGIKGAPPPPTTKATIFHHGGYQSQLLLNATGYATVQKWALYETQLRRKLKASGADKDLNLLEFQMIGVPEANPKTQLSSTTYMRVFAEGPTQAAIMGFLASAGQISLQHFSGFHSTLDARIGLPKSFLVMHPVLYMQDLIRETITFINANTGAAGNPVEVGHPPRYEDLETRENVPTTVNGIPLSDFGPTEARRLGDRVLARSGDKGSNLNVGFFVRNAKAWDWLRSFLSSEKLIDLIGDDWRDDFFIERVEFSNISAVHFVIYGILGRGVSSSSRLDSLGKGFADYVRDKVVEIPIDLEQ